MPKVYNHTCIGMISGSSLDGLDVACVRFEITPDLMNPIVSWELLEVMTFEFPEAISQQLQTLPKSSALDLVQMDDTMGSFMAKCASDIKGNLSLDFICSHGHTVFHHPGKSSTQIGNPAIIAAKTGIKTIGHIRNMDTAYGGQGAPLAPMADLYLFPDHKVCINLGGIANISIKQDSEIIGYDVCGANQFLNYLAQKNGISFDDALKRQRQI